MLKRKIIEKILGVSPKTVYNYYKEDRPIIKLLESSFSNEDLEAFLKDGAMSGNWLAQNKLNQELINRIERLEEKIKKMEESNEN